MNYHSLADEVTQYSLSFFNAPENQYLSYHNLAHTEGVLKAAIQIGHHYQLDDADFFIVMAASWFHDTGYFSGGPVDHEQRGAAKAAGFLKKRGVDESTISKVESCIIATRLPQSPVTLLEQIVCDADLFHFGTAEFTERNKLMREECKSTSPNAPNKQQWRLGSINLLQSHHYHTEYCKLLLNNKKQENLDKLLQKQEESLKKNSMVSVRDNEIEIISEKSTKRKEKNERPNRGIETMFRVASTNHQRLSDMCDNKAHIMISVNSIIISVIIGLVVQTLNTNPRILIPTLILLTGSLIATVFAVLATRPKIPGGFFSKAQVEDKTVNLLFFGNFYKMDFSDYSDGMKKVMADREFLYGSLIRDIYSQGIVLGRKFKYIRISYTIFMYTLIISIIAYAIATIFFYKTG